MPGPVFLRGGTVDLHTIEKEDLSYLHRLVNDPRVWRSLFNADPQTMADEEGLRERRQRRRRDQPSHL